MPLTSRDDVVRIELSTPGEWVDVKRRLSKGEQTRIQASGVDLKMALNGDVVGVHGDLPADQVLDTVTFRGLEIGIVAWCFDVELTPENIRLLDPDDYDIIKERLDELWRPRSDDEKGNSGGAGANSRKATVQRQKS